MADPLRWMLSVAEARNVDPKAKTVNLKFSRRTLTMWQERARAPTAAPSPGAAREVAEAGTQGNATQPEPLRTVVESFVASIETYYTPKGAAPRLHGCLMCDPLNPWNESDTDASGPTREQFTHWPDCKIGRLKAALADRQPTPPAVAGPKEGA